MSWSFPTAEIRLPVGAVIGDPVSVTLLALTATAYIAGRHRWRAATERSVGSEWCLASFMLGLIAVGVALASPLDRAATGSLTAHMVQHVLLLSVAGPLLALGAPIPALLWALPARGRVRALRTGRWLIREHDRHFPTWVVTALGLTALWMWAWHLPIAYQAAVGNPALHAAEHASFLLASTAAWWSIVTGRRSRRGAAAIAALIGSLAGMGLGAAMVLAPRPWYPAYVTRSATPLTDQQVAGVVMWAFGGMAAVVAGAALFAGWLRSAGPTDDRRGWAVPSPQPAPGDGA